MSIVPTSYLSLSFIGGGQMCEAMLRGLLRAGVCQPQQVSISEPLDTRRDYLRQSFDPRITLVADNSLVIDKDIVVIAVKPQAISEALAPVRARGNTRPLFISIVAGVTIQDLESWLPSSARVVRSMPNTPATISESASAYALGRACTSNDEHLVKRILHCIGPVALCVQEKLLDGVTGLSGSGPAFVFVFLEAMADAAVAQGVPRDVALKLAAQTFVGAGKMVLDAKNHPAALKDAVCSPAGTTVAGILAAEEAGLRNAAIKAVTAAARRSRELAKPNAPHSVL
jgi:pyrroline-5-carboxylate reductase